MSWLLAIVLSTAHAKAHHSHARSAAVPALTKVGVCDSPKATKTVKVIKQWHLAPKTVTKSFKEKYPQEKNQTAIYLALADAIKNKKIQLLVSEGCEGEIDEHFKATFNGWNYADLKEQSQRKGYEKILTLIPLKIEARFSDQINTRCGDDEKLIQEGNVRLSNLRGWAGFWGRLHENKGDPEKIKPYAESAADLLKVPRTTTVDDLLGKIKERIKSELDLFKKSLVDRDAAFVKVLSEQTYETAAVVIGGLHADDLKEQLQKAGIGCEILEPPGYTREDEDLIELFQAALKK